MEHSERGRYVTDRVSVWIVNDGDHFDRAQTLLATTPGTEALGTFLSLELRAARKGTAAWHTAQELAPNDYKRIDWEEVAHQLVGE